jgi:transposase
MMEARMNGKRVIAVDVGKFSLDVAVEDCERVRHLANEGTAVERFVAGLDPARDVVVFERTGGYERLLEACLARAGVAWAVLHPLRVAAFRRARGIKAKTDAIDAKLLRAFGRDRLNGGDLRFGRAADVTLHALLARRRQLEAAAHAERCRLDVAASAAVRGSIERSIAHIEAELVAIEVEVSAHAAADHQFRRRCEVMCRQAGVAETTARTLLAELPELGRLSAKEAASLGALAPRVYESGTIKRRRGLTPGRAAVKRALFFPALVAMRHDPDLAGFAKRLKERGKPGMVIVVAVMRKLLVRLNARLRDTLTPEVLAAADAAQPAV